MSINEEPTTAEYIVNKRIQSKKTKNKRAGMYILTYIRNDIKTYIYVYIHTYIHIYIYIYKQNSKNPS